MTKLNQILAIDTDVRKRARTALERAAKEIRNDGPMNGLSRTYQPRDDDGDRLPSESVRVQVTAEQVTEWLTDALGRLWDITATKDWANTHATANVTVDGETLIHDAPATFLIWFEKQIAELRACFATLPTLDPDTVWTYDASTVTWRSEPVETIRTRKVPRNHVAYEATPEHPAQVQVYNEDVAEGVWTTTRFSGAVSAQQKAELLVKLDDLGQAVKFAREEANQVTVEDIDVAGPVLSYLFD